MNHDSSRPRLRRRLLLVAGTAVLAAGAGGAIALQSGNAAPVVHLTAATTTPSTPAAPAPATGTEAPESTTPESTTGAAAAGAPSDGPGGFADPAGVDVQTEQTGDN